MNHPMSDSEPLIFLHAFPLNRSMWAEQEKFFSRFREVITFDWPGFGETPPAPPGKGMSSFVDSLRSEIEQRRVERAHICGLSMGGYAALAFYRASPEIVSSLILCDTRATADTPDVRQTRYATAEVVVREGLTSLIESMPARLLGETTLRERPAIIERVQQMIGTARPAGVADALIAMAERGDSTDLLPQISVKTLIIVGREDKLSPPEEMRPMANAIRNSSFAVIDEAGHLPNIEQPYRFNQILRDFLSTE